MDTYLQYESWNKKAEHYLVWPKPEAQALGNSDYSPLCEWPWMTVEALCGGEKQSLMSRWTWNNEDQLYSAIGGNIQSSSVRTVLNNPDL